MPDPAPTASGLDQVYAYQISKTKDVVTIVTLALTLTQEMLDPTADLVIVADQLTLPKTELKLPGRSLSIRARKLACNGGALDLSGKPGSPGDNDPAKLATPDEAGYDQPGKAGASGAPGTNGVAGGALSIVAGTITGVQKLVSNGGAGGAGGNGGAAGKGGRGSAGRSDEVRTRGHRQEQSIDEVGAAGRPGQPGGRGGDSGKPGDGGNGGAVRVRCLAPLEPSQLTITAAAGAAGAPGTAGRRGDGGRGGAGGVRLGWVEERRGHFQERHIVEVGRYPNGGDAKPGGDGTVLKASPGTAKAPDAGPVKDKAELVSLDDAVFGQHQLALHQAQLWYMNGEFAEARDALVWLRACTPADGKADKWAALHVRADVLLERLRRGFDYFGNYRNFVPIASYKLYRQTLDSMLAVGHDVETVYQDFTARLKTQTKADEVFRKALQGVGAAVGQCDEDRKQLVSLREAVWGEAQDLRAKTIAQGEVLKGAAQSFKQAVERKAACASFLAMFDIVIAIATCAVDVAATVKAAQGAVKAAEAAADALEKVKSVSSLDVFKNLVTVTKDVRGLYDKWVSIKDFNTPTSPDMAKLVETQAELEDQLKPYLDMPEAVAYKKAIRDYVNLAQAMNAKLAKYVAVNDDILLVQGRRDQLQRQGDELQAEEAKDFDPTLSPYRCFILGLYSDMKMRILQRLYEEVAAYRYVSLEDYPFRGADNTIGELAVIHGKVQDMVIERINQTLAPKQPFRDFAHELSGAATDRATQFADFKKTGRLTFSIPISDERYLGLARVLATTWRVTLEGVETTLPNNRVYVRLRHHGDPLLLDEKKGVHVFSHRDVRSFCQYETIKGDEVVSAGGVLGDVEDKERIGLSPFATWTLEVPDNYNPGLKLGGVTKIVLRFSGECAGMEALLAAARARAAAS